MSGHKTRLDAWGATLTEEQMWAVYSKVRAMAWHEASEWIYDEYGIEPPSRAAFYRFLSRMRKLDATLRLRRAGADDERLISAYKTLAADAVMSGDDPAAAQYVKMAMELANSARAAKELRLKEAAQRTKDEQLKLAREKFEAAAARLSAAVETVEDERLSDEERVKRVREILGR